MPLAELKNLQMLKLENTSVTDFGPLEKLTNLQEFYLEGTKVNDGQIADLKTALPDLVIYKTYRL